MFSLNFIYYPISAVLWFWHKAFSFVLNPASGITWVLSIMMLVFTIRILLLKPTINQMRSSRRMAEFQPKMQELKKKYGNDQQKLREETRKVQKEMGVNPLASCLPALVQMPIFIGLYHVLKSFNRTGHRFAELGMTVEQTRNTPNYIFGVDEVQSFLDARLFGTPLSAYISMDPASFGAFSPDGQAADFTKTNIMIVLLPLILASAVIMHFTARMNLDRTKKRQAANPNKPSNPMGEQMQAQMDIMQKMMLWFIPVMYLFGGYFWQVGLAIYMFFNNVWTLVQQRMLFSKMDSEEAAEKAEKIAQKRTSAPKPGVRPDNPKKKPKNKKVSGSGANAVTDKATSDKKDQLNEKVNVAKKVEQGDAKPSNSSDGAAQVAGESGGTTKPKPGARPNKNKRKKKR